MLPSGAVEDPAGVAATEAPTWFTLSGDDVAQRLGVDPERGLTADEAAKRLQQYGPNKFAEAKAEPRWRAFIRQYRDPMQIVLLAAGIGSLYPIKEYGTGILIIFLTLFNAVLGLRQEGKAAAAVAALQKMMIVKARVRRDGSLAELPAEQLAPGDVVSLEAGDVVPADGRLLQRFARDRRVGADRRERAGLEGRRDGRERRCAARGPDGHGLHEHERDQGLGRVRRHRHRHADRGGPHLGPPLDPGGHEDPPHPPAGNADQADPLHRRLRVGGLDRAQPWRGHEFTSVFTAAVAFAIAAIPTGLPAVVTTILSYGTQMLAKANAIVKRLRSTETLGSTSAINSDKTGTLTLNQMTAVEMAIPGRKYTISGTGYSTEGTIRRVAGEEDVPLDQFLMPMVLAADAVVTDAGEMIGDPTEGALVVLAEKGGLDAESTRAEFPRIAELPFDTAYKLMATFHRMQDESGKDVVRAFVKGAPDQLLDRSTGTLDWNLAALELNDELRQRYNDENQRLAERGLRVLATARKDFEPDHFDPNVDLLELMNGLTVLTLVGIVDPPRPTAKASIEIAKDAGIQVRMITGDHAITAEAIAKQLGIEGRAITGAEFAAMSDEEVQNKIGSIGVIARVTPEDKVRLVDNLKKKNLIVAMTGDGVNDAPALKRAESASQWASPAPRSRRRRRR